MDLDDSHNNHDNHYNYARSQKGPNSLPPFSHIPPTRPQRVLAVDLIFWRRIRRNILGDHMDIIVERIDPAGHVWYNERLCLPIDIIIRSLLQPQYETKKRMTSAVESFLLVPRSPAARLTEPLINKEGEGGFVAGQWGPERAPR